jgi:hypothetical protein
MQRILPFILLAAVLSGCSPEAKKMTPEESKHIEQLTAHMTPRCIGRYLVDLPESFVLNSESHAEVEEATISVMPMKETVFEHRLAQREAELRKKHMDGEPNNPFLKKIIALPNGAIGNIFNRAEESGSLDVGRTLELWGWKDGYAIRADIKSTDASDPKYVSDSYWKSRGSDTPQKLAQLLKVYERTRGRTDTEIPKEQGVCFANGFVSGPATDEEWVDMNHYLSSADDVYFRFISMSHIGPEEDTLLQRGAGINEMLKQVNGRTLRKGAREANGLKYEEWLVMRESDPGVPDYHMTLEMNSKEGNAKNPLVTFDMSSGVRKPGPSLSVEESIAQKPITKATLDEAESVALWDKVTATLRPRPGAF